MKHILLAACAVAILSGCGSQGKQAAPTGNPFLSEYTTPFQVPPFDQIKMEHYKPAFLQGMEEQQKEIDAIVNNPEPFNLAPERGGGRGGHPEYHCSTGSKRSVTS